MATAPRSTALTRLFGLLAAVLLATGLMTGVADAKDKFRVA
jgi:hypothetical protein